MDPVDLIYGNCSIEALQVNRFSLGIYAQRIKFRGLLSDEENCHT